MRVFIHCIHSSHLTALLLDPSDPALLALYSKKVDSGEKIKEMMLLFFFIYKKSDKSANNVSSNSLFLSSTNSCTSTWSRTAGKGKSVLNFESSCFPGIRQKRMTLPYNYRLYSYMRKVSKYFFRCHLCGINISSARTKHCSVCNKWEDFRIVKILREPVKNYLAELGGTPLLP